ncbi:MAG: hypothetical protein ACYC27_05065 [Armatimonadota bacterium]
MSTISIRVHTRQWQDPALFADLLTMLKEYRHTVTEVAFFTASTHPPLPLNVIQQRTEYLGSKVIPAAREIGLHAGINYLGTLGHLDEYPEGSLNEPWQHLVDISGVESPSCYCSYDPRVQEYIDRCYTATALADPSFIWIDDDIRLESHPKAIRYACFCPFCLESFNRESGGEWTRESLHNAFNSGANDERLHIRRLWQEHNSLYITRLLESIRRAVDQVNPNIMLGLMTGETAYSAFTYDRRVDAMSGQNRIEVKWRPGGGFYTDEVPLGAIDKAHSIGRQISFIPKSVTDIQYEHENFPYQLLRKSEALFAAEMAATTGAGCTGTALNIMNMHDSPRECEPYIIKTQETLDFLKTAADTFGRSDCRGICIPSTEKHFSAVNIGGDWEESGFWGEDFTRCNELSSIGFPMAYSPDGAAVNIITQTTCVEYSKDEITKMLSGGVFIDAPALDSLHKIGLGSLCGFSVSGRKDVDSIERFTNHPFNGEFAGRHRDCRPSFYGEPVYLIKPEAQGAEVISEVVDFNAVVHGACAGLYENELGGRVAIFGYYPWRMIQNTAKVFQLKEVLRWLSNNQLPAYVASYHKAAIWCRQDPAGDTALLILNASVDTINDVTVAVAGNPVTMQVMYMDGRTEMVTPTADISGYASYKIDKIGPWQAILLRNSANIK